MDTGGLTPSDSATSTGESFAQEARQVFVDWEWLRVPYNGFLIVESVGGLIWVDRLYAVMPTWLLLVNGVFAAIAANVCYLAGPAVETYLRWLGVRSPAVRIALWTVGLLFSLFVTAVVFVTIEQNAMLILEQNPGLRHER